MKAQLDNILMSSMIVWMDNILLSEGEAYQNYNSKFYPITNITNIYLLLKLPKTLTLFCRYS